MAQSISEIQAVMEERGIPAPENEQAFLALYDYLMQTDDVPPAIDPDTARGLGINVQEDPAGGFRIDPTTPGYTEMPNGTVVGPPGGPSSANGEVFAGIPNSVSPEAVDITYDTLTVFPG